MLETSMNLAVVGTLCVLKIESYLSRDLKNHVIHVNTYFGPVSEDVK